MDISNLASFANIKAQSQLMQAVQISVAKIALDQTQVATQAMVKMMEQSVNPSVGSNLDIRL